MNFHLVPVTLTWGGFVRALNAYEMRTFTSSYISIVSVDVNNIWLMAASTSWNTVARSIIIRQTRQTLKHLRCSEANYAVASLAVEFQLDFSLFLPHGEPPRRKKYYFSVKCVAKVFQLRATSWLILRLLWVRITGFRKRPKRAKLNEPQNAGVLKVPIHQDWIFTTVFGWFWMTNGRMQIFFDLLSEMGAGLNGNPLRKKISPFVQWPRTKSSPVT